MPRLDTFAYLLRTLGLGILLGVLAVLHQAQAQPSPTPNEPVATAPGRPLWSDLTAGQQQALEPLSQLWPTMTEPHKRKWLALSKNFPQLSSEEQSVLQGRMREWVGLSPRQRTLARLHFADTQQQQLSLEEKRAKWEAYQALSQEEKKKLATQQPKPINSAAPAVKPLLAPKITLPPPATSNKPLPRIASDQLDHSTLLPTAAASAPAAAASALPVTPEPATDTTP
jgi:Protein of unknown function (DUF3106)